jgi:hypothetical protein
MAVTMVISNGYLWGWTNSQSVFNAFLFSSMGDTRRELVRGICGEEVGPMTSKSGSGLYKNRRQGKATIVVTAWQAKIARKEGMI